MVTWIDKHSILSLREGVGSKLANGPVIISDAAVEAGAEELYVTTSGKSWSAARVDEVTKAKHIVRNILTVAAIADLLEES